MSGPQPPKPTPPPMPMRRHLESLRDDPRREKDDRPPAEPTPDEHLRRLVHQLATAELQRAQSMPRIEGYLKAIAEAVVTPAGLQTREKTVSRLEMEAELEKAKAIIVAEVSKGESMRAQARLVQKIGAFVVATMSQSWKVAVAIVVTAILSVVGTVLVREVLPALHTAPAVPAAHP